MKKVCQICSGSMTFWAKKNHYRSYKCKKCHFVSILPLPTDEQLAVAYSNYYSGRQKNKKFKKDRDEMFLIERDFLTKYLNKGKILDYGCSDGGFLTKFDKKYTKYGYEQSEDAVKAGKKKNKMINFLSYENLKKKRNFLDCVILRGVIEHFNNLHEEINLISKLIKKNKYIFITSTPNNNSLGAQLYKENWVMFEPPYHLLYFDDQNLEQFFNKKNFKLVKKAFFYDETPYQSRNDLSLILKDIKSKKFKKSPPFYGTMMTMLLKKIK